MAQCLRCKAERSMRHFHEECRRCRAIYEREQEKGWFFFAAQNWFTFGKTLAERKEFYNLAQKYYAAGGGPIEPAGIPFTEAEYTAFLRDLLDPQYYFSLNPDPPRIVKDDAEREKIYHSQRAEIFAMMRERIQHKRESMAAADKEYEEKIAARVAARLATRDNPPGEEVL